MFRYLALIWNEHDEAASGQAKQLRRRIHERLPSWACPSDVPGLLFCHANTGVGSARTIELSHRQGVIFGNLFHRDDARDTALPVNSLSDAECSSIVKQGSTRLLDRYWGRYVALFSEEMGDGVRLLRDPSGALPCYLVEWQGVHMVFADVEDCMAIENIAMSVDWDGLALTLSQRRSFASPLILKGMTEVRPGEEVRFDRGKVRRSIAWNPLRIAGQDPIEDFEGAVAQLNRVLRMCVNAWASQYPRIVVRISGGLDSSILLSSLCNAPTQPAITCLHYYATGAGEDERRYARIVAEHLGASLVEKDLDERPVKLEGVLQGKRTANVGSLLYDVEHRRYESQLAADAAAEAGRCSGLFSGAGGDGVFYQARADLATADYLLRYGLQAQLIAVARDASEISRKSICALLLNAVRERTCGTARHALLESAGPTHPWLENVEARQVPAGKLWHTLSGVVAPAGISALAQVGDPEETLPFLSQPLVELCLRIPTYLLIRGGRDRAVSRQAFAGEVPAAILNRTQKGLIHRHLHNMFEHNLEFIRALLLDGIMLRNGLLKRQQLEPLLLGHLPADDRRFVDVLTRLVPTEAWVRSWHAGANAAR